jgi:hypothetical protein
MDLKEIGFENVNLTELTQDRDQWRNLLNTGSITSEKIPNQFSSLELVKIKSTFLTTR